MPSENDMVFGHLAVSEGFATAEAVELALKTQMAVERDGRVTTRDRVMIEEGLMTPEQVASVQRAQGRRVVLCAGCSGKLNVSALEPGRSVMCPRCGRAMVVPDTEKAPPDDESDTSKITRLTGCPPAK
jgi:DNA-directed RNA polymerase subunit RPC12/RpoP